MNTDERRAAVEAAKLLPLTTLHARRTEFYEKYEEAQLRLKIAARKGEPVDEIKGEVAQALDDWITPYTALKELLGPIVERATGLTADVVRGYL